MKRKEVKGFTLIELLAIIVILAIIALITVPIILNVIDNSKVGAAKDSAYGFKDAVSKFYVTKLYEDQNFKLNGTYIVTDGKMSGDGMDNVEIPVSGNVPSSGSLVYKNNVLESGYLIIDDYRVEIENGEIKNTTKDGSSVDSSDDNGDSDDVVTDDNNGNINSGENDETGDSGGVDTGGLTGESQLTIKVINSWYQADISVSITPAVTDNLTYYYYQKTGNEDYSLVYSGTENDYTYDDLLENFSYYLKVVAVDSNGKSVSAEIPFTMSYCFVAGTKVYTENGYMNIEDIKVGDYVYAIDLETNEQMLKKVENTIISDALSLYHLTIENEVVSSTPRHEFYIVDKGWVRAYDLEIGDQVITNDGIKTISEIVYEKLDEPIKVYNMTIDGLHNYLVTEYSILVHNVASLT